MKTTSFSRHGLLLAALLFCLFANVGIAHGQPKDDYVPGVVLVGIRPEMDDNLTPVILSAIGKVVDKIDDIHLYKLRLPDTTAIPDAIAVLQKRTDVVFAEPDYIFHLASPPLPNDYYLTHGYNTGIAQYGPQNIRANLAWPIWQPRQQIVVAVIDSGVDGTHPDLKNKMLLGTDGKVKGYDAINAITDIATDVYGHGTHVAGILAA